MPSFVKRELDPGQEIEQIDRVVTRSPIHGIACRKGTIVSLDEALACLRADPDYQIIHRSTPPDFYDVAAPGDSIVKVAVVDIETTGRSHEDDAIVELGIVVCEVCERTGHVFRVLDRFDALQDPGFAIPLEAIAVHKITDAMVAGRRIDDDAVGHLMEGVMLVVAHNAKFDRPFLEARLPVFQQVAWACSYEQIDWVGQDIASAKLEYIAYKHGIFYDAHRALMDCEVLLHVLQSSRLGSGNRPMEQLLTAARADGYRLGALNSPFAMKDLMKARGYRWDPDAQIWTVLVLSKEKAREEARWMRDAVYGGRACRIQVEAMPATLRFSKRAGEMSVEALTASPPQMDDAA
jgi:DNA polymerase-3 subunit epsilon